MRDGGLSWKVRYAGPVKSDFGIEGLCTSPSLDGNGRVLLTQGCHCDALPIPLLWEHDEAKQIGEVVWLRKINDVGIFMRASIDSHQVYVWKEIQRGDLYRLSIGWKNIDVDVRPDVTVTREWRLREVSIVACAANPDAIFTPYTPPHRRVFYLPRAA